MLRQVKENCRLIDNKNLVDTIYAVGKLHQGLKTKEDLNKYGDQKFFQHFFRDMLTEVLGRVDQLSLMQITYLAKGLLNSRRFLDANNSNIENEICQALKQKCLQVYRGQEERFQPYTISKLIRYFSRHEEDAGTLQLYHYLGK